MARRRQPGLGLRPRQPDHCGSSAIRTQRFRACGQRWQRAAGDALCRDGSGRLYRPGYLACRGTGCRARPDRRRACACQSQALYQWAAGRPGHGRLNHHPLLLDDAARCGRGCTLHVGDGRGATLEGRPIAMRHGAWRGYPYSQRTHVVLWRTGGSRRHGDAAREAHPEGSQGLSADRQISASRGHAREGQWHVAIRYRYPRTGHEGGDRAGMPDLRRDAGRGGRYARTGAARRAQSGEAGQRRRRRRRTLLGGEARHGGAGYPVASRRWRYVHHRTVVQGPGRCVRARHPHHGARSRGREQGQGQSHLGDLSATPARARHHGADQHHRARAPGRLRYLGRHAGAGALRRCGDESDWPAGRAHPGAQPVPGRWLRQALVRGFHRAGGGHRQGRGLSGQGDLDPRGRYRARPLPPGLLRPHLRHARRQWPAAGMDGSHHRRFGAGHLRAGRHGQERPRFRHGGMRGRASLRNTQPARGLGAP